jgi:hypothetical protein
MSSHICHFCNHVFQKKFNLQRHLTDNKCEAYRQLSAVEIQKIMTYNIDRENLLQQQIDKLQSKETVQKEIEEIQPEIEQQLTFDGIFKGRESEIRITPDKMISVFDFIKVVGGQTNPKQTWKNIQKNHSKELGIVAKCHYSQFGKTKKTPVINVQDMVKLLFLLPGEMAKQFRSKSAETMIRYLGGDINDLKCLEEIKEIQPENEQQLTFDGIFKGRESEIRITPDKMISVFDFIKVVGGQINPRKTWADILKNHKEEVVTFCYNLQFPGSGQSKTPVVNVQGMVKLLFWLPGEMAKQFRSKSAETMIRYLGGDLTLIDEIKAIDQMHVENPNNIAQVFREEVNETNRLNYDQINHSKELLSHFGSKTEIFYMLLFSLAECWYLKFGIVNLRCFYERYNEHVIEFGPDICVVDAFQSPDVTKIESEHKNSVFFKQHSIKLPKKSGTGNHVEIYQLSETLTYNKIKQEILKTANDRITDPPPSYTSIENSSELTKQIEAKEKSEQEREKTKQKQLELDQEHEKTKQKQLEFEIKKLEYEMMKFNKNV